MEISLIKLFYDKTYNIALCMIIFFNYSLSFAQTDNINYYDEYIYKNIFIENPNVLNKYLEDKTKITIGCISKGIFGAGVLLFSLDPKNDYLFKNKNLEITIGELLENRKKYLESLNTITEIQKNKLNFINELMGFTSPKILDVKIYKILNSTSIFADDYNNYLLYFIIQKFVNIFSDDYKDLLALNIIQYLSINSKNKVNVKYSSMGFMYLAKLMSLMTDKNDFYSEINDRIFKPLNLENNFIPVDSLTKKDLKNRFPNQNHLLKLKNNFIKINIYDIEYSKMDTLNAGLITDLESAISVVNEIAKMYFGFKNVLIDNPKLASELLFKYRKIYSEINKKFHSLGSYMRITDKKLYISMSGSAFGKKVVISSAINKIKNYKYDSFDNYRYEINNYGGPMNIEVVIISINRFLRGLFFKNEFFFIDEDLKEIMAKSIFTAYNIDGKNIDLDEINWLINYNPQKLIKQLKMEVNKNIVESKTTNDKKEWLKEKFEKYFETFEKYLTTTD